MEKKNKTAKTAAQSSKRSAAPQKSKKDATKKNPVVDKKTKDHIWSPVLGKFVSRPAPPQSNPASYISDHALRMFHQMGHTLGVKGFDPDAMADSTDFTVSRKGFAVIQAAHRAVVQHAGMPESWRPYAQAIMTLLKIAKVFTPPHIDALIDKIILAIEIALQELKK